MLKVAALKGREKGRRAFILANGPSILSHNLSLLDGELIIGMNASTKIEIEHGIHADYYAVSDARFLFHPEKRRYATQELHNDTVRVVRSDISNVDDHNFLRRSYYVCSLGRDGYSWNLKRGFYFGCTTTMLTLQLATYLGCPEIYLLGLDLHYASDRARFYREAAPQPADPFTSVQMWNIANAHREMNARGIKLSICSDNSLLRPYLPFTSFNNLFGQGR